MEVMERLIVEDWVSDVLIKIGIKPNKQGYWLLIDSVLVAIDQNALCSTGDLYSKVASKNNLQPKNVERNIRSAVEKAFDNKTLIRINSILGIDAMDETYCMTNSELISLLARYAIRHALRHRKIS